MLITLNTTDNAFIAAYIAMDTTDGDANDALAAYGAARAAMVAAGRTREEIAFIADMADRLPRA